MSKVFLLDFDHTLFNNSKFFKDIKRALKRLGVNDDLFRKTYLKARYPGPYTLFSHLTEITTETNLDLIKAKQKTYQILENGKKYLYKDTVPFIQALKSKGYFVIVYTYGQPDFQQRKIDSCGLANFVDDVQITADESKVNLLKYKYSNYLDRIIVIDDNPNVLKGMKAQFPGVRLIRMMRKENKKYNVISLGGVTQVKNLTGVESLL